MLLGEVVKALLRGLKLHLHGPQGHLDSFARVFMGIRCIFGLSRLSTMCTPTAKRMTITTIAIIVEVEVERAQVEGGEDIVEDFLGTLRSFYNYNIDDEWRS